MKERKGACARMPMREEHALDEHVHGARNRRLDDTMRRIQPVLSRPVVANSPY
jgi:hypothetical protein